MDLIMANLDAILYGAGLIVLLLIFMPFSPMMIDILLLPRGMQIGIYRYRHLLWLFVWLCAAVVMIRGFNAIEEPSGMFAPVASAIKTALGDWAPALLGSGDPVWITVVLITAAVMGMMFWSGYVPYVMTPPANPKLLDVAEADRLISDDDIVLGTTGGGEAHAYPRDNIARPHYFEDSIGGQRITVSYCILCNSGIAFKPEIAGKPVRLRCVTAYNNNIIYYDPDGRNYIQQLDGSVFHGPDKGAVLEQHPLVQARWGEWKQLYPHTKLYYAPENSLRDRMVGAMLQMMIPIDKLMRRKTPWHRIRGKLDTRLPAMSFVYAIERNGERKGYAQDDLARLTAINDSLGGDPVAVLYDANRDIGDIFLRRVGERSLTFEPASGEDDVIVRDTETGSLWDIAGRAVSGELQGNVLERLPHYNKLFWFSWPLFKPDAGLEVPARS